MSERTHSPEVAATSEMSVPAPVEAVRRRRRIMPVFAGTSAAVIGAVVLFQVLRPEPAASQTREPAPATGAQGGTRAPGTSNAVASVNGQPISYDALAKECVQRHGPEVLENLINKTLIEQACASRQINVTRAEIDQEVMSIAKKFNLPADTWYQMLQAERGLSPRQYQNDIIWPMVALKKLAGSEITPTEEDMRNAFEREYGPRVKARMILLEGNIRNATQVWEEVNQNPDSFEAVARTKSSDPNTRPLGGVIPPIRRNGGNPNVEEQAFKLKTGEISPVIQVAENRYVIIKCEGQTEQLVEDPKQVWSELYNTVVDEKTQQSVAKVFEKVKQDARIINHLTNDATPVGQIRNGQPIQPASASGASEGRVRTAGGK